MRLFTIKRLVAKQIKRSTHRSLSQDWIGGEPFLVSFEQLLLAFAWVFPFQLFDQAECGRSCFLIHRCFPSATIFTGLKRGTEAPRPRLSGADRAAVDQALYISVHVALLDYVEAVDLRSQLCG